MATGPERVYVHVGLPKTGTTFLQDLMRGHRGALREVGVCYPDDGHRDHFFAALDARGDHTFAGGVRPAARGAWPRLVELTLSCEQRTAVIGHEVMATASAEQARAALSMLTRGVETHVVVTARDPARQVVADWQESVKHGRRHRFSQYARNAGLGNGSGRTPENGPAPFRAQRLTDVLDNWGGDLPPERVHVVTVPRPGAEPGLLWRRFAGVLDVTDPDRFRPGDDVRANPSLGVADIEVMRRVSEFLAKRLVAAEFGAVVKNSYAQGILPRVSRSAAPVAPAGLLSELQTLGTRWTQTITERGYDVRGELADLVPAPTEGPEPDDWEAEDVIDTATAATAELLLEVARLRRELEAAHGAPRGVPGMSGRAGRLLRRRR